MMDEILQEDNKKQTIIPKVTAFTTGIFVISILCIFPLVFKDYYFDILPVKYKYYYTNVLILAGIFLLLVVIPLIIKNIAKLISVVAQKPKLKLHISDVSLGSCGSNIRVKISKMIPEVSMLCFLTIAGISTLLSDYVYESFWGNEGRYTGFFLLLLYGISFFIVSKYLKFKSWYLDLFLISSMLVCLFGIIQYFQIDFLGFKELMLDYQRDLFTSTLGNINTYTAFVAMVTGVSVTLFVQSKRKIFSLWYYICSIISFFAIITGKSDNAYLALGALFGFLPFYVFRTRKGIKRYFVIIATFFSVIQGIDYINTRWSSHVLGVDSLFKVLVNYDNLLYFVVSLWIFCGMWYLADYMAKREDGKASIWYRYAWTGLVSLVVLVIIYMLYDANLGGNAERYHAIRNYFVINDDWGTHRWYIWRIGLENYMDFSFIHKVFGYGPDTFGILTMNNNYEEMLGVYNEIFDSAHNEYLQYFITIGPFGLISYLALLISSGVRMVKRAGDNPYVIAALFAVICYGAQALVNINVPIATPVMWTLLMLGLAGCSSGKNICSPESLKETI